MMIGRGIDAVLYYGESDEELKPLEKVELSSCEIEESEYRFNREQWTPIKCREINNGKETDKIECTTIEDMGIWDESGFFIACGGIGTEMVCQINDEKVINAIGEAVKTATENAICEINMSICEKDRRKLIKALIGNRYCNNWRKMHGLPMRRRVKR